jgi:hypothetical protein
MVTLAGKKDRPLDQTICQFSRLRWLRGQGADPADLCDGRAAEVAGGDGGVRDTPRRSQRSASRGKLALHEEFPDALHRGDRSVSG